MKTLKPNFYNQFTMQKILQLKIWQYDNTVWLKNGIYAYSGMAERAEIERSEICF